MSGTMTPGGDYDIWAWLYDRTLGPDYSAAKSDFLDRALYAAIPPGGRLLDLCCGTGQMMKPALARGFDVTGLDLSPDMLRHAAQNVPKAHLIEGDARNFTLAHPVDAVLCASASLNHMPDQAALARVFRAVHAALVPGGRFVFDINHPAQMTKHWRNIMTAGEIRHDYAWSITPRYDPDMRQGAFRVDMFRRPDGVCPPGPAVLLRLLHLPFGPIRRYRLGRLSRFARRHPDWNHLCEDFPVYGHDLKITRTALQNAGFAVSLETFDAGAPVSDDTAACFVCTKEMEAAQ